MCRAVTSHGRLSTAATAVTIAGDRVICKVSSGSATRIIASATFVVPAKVTSNHSLRLLADGLISSGEIASDPLCDPPSS
jgi:hypothetical protein